MRTRKRYINDAFEFVTNAAGISIDNTEEHVLENLRAMFEMGFVCGLQTTAKIMGIKDDKMHAEALSDIDHEKAEIERRTREQMWFETPGKTAFISTKQLYD